MIQVLLSTIMQWLFNRPDIAFVFSMLFFAQSLFATGFIIGYILDQKNKRNAASSKLAMLNHYKELSESLEKYRNAGPREEFYRKEANHKNNELIRMKRKFAAVLDIALEST